MVQRSRILRFVGVGFANAAISFGILNLCFYKLHQSKITSSVIATTCALLFSFALNRSFVFADRSQRAYRQFLPFAVVTISGSLVVINVVYIITIHLLNGHESGIIHILQHSTGFKFSASFLDINLSTVIGAIAAMIWNYNGYRLFVFKGSTPDTNKDEAVTTTEETA